MASGSVQYARSGDVYVAYATFGEGPVDLVYVPGFVSCVDLFAEWLAQSADGFFTHTIDRFSRFARVIVFDKRGTGSSDRSVGVADLETRMDDLRAVMDAVGSERAHLFGVSEGGPMAILFAATFPQRTLSLTLYDSIANGVRDEESPWIGTTEEREAAHDAAIEVWGSGIATSFFSPHDEINPTLTERCAAFETRGASPGALRNLWLMNDQIDVRPILSAVSVPTLVIHASHDPVVPVEAGRYLATQIPGARLFEFELAGHVTSRPERMDPWIDEVEEFVTGARPLGPVGERVLATVLYTDIVGSTQQAERVGDAAWKRLLDQHDKVIEHEVQRFRGVPVKHTGDGVLCRFDGPARALSCGLALATAIRALGIEVRTGVHTGEVETRGDDLGGIALHVGARVMALAQPGEVLTTRTVRDLVAGSGLSFDDRGEHALKGLSEPVHLYAAHM